MFTDASNRPISVLANAGVCSLTGFGVAKYVKSIQVAPKDAAIFCFLIPIVTRIVTPFFRELFCSKNQTTTAYFLADAASIITTTVLASITVGALGYPVSIVSGLILFGSSVILAKLLIISTLALLALASQGLNQDNPNKYNPNYNPNKL